MTVSEINVRANGVPPLLDAVTDLLDALTVEAEPDVLESAIDRLCLVAGRLGADPRGLDRAALRAARAVQAVRRSEQDLLALHEAVAELSGPGTLESRYTDVPRLLARLVPGIDRAWLDATDSGDDATLSVPLTSDSSSPAVLHASRCDSRPFTPAEIAIAHRYARPAAAALAAASGERSAAMVDTLLRIASGTDLPSLPDMVAVIEKGLSASVSVRDSGAASAEATHVVTSGSLSLLANRETTLPQESIRDFHRAAQVLNTVLMRRNATLHAIGEVRDEMLIELLGTHRALPSSTRALGAARGLRLDLEQVVVAIGAVRIPDNMIGDIAHHLGGVGGRFAGTLVAVVPATDPRRAADEVTARLRRLGARPTVCAADPIDPADGGLADSFDTAHHGLRLLTAIGHLGVATTANELAIYRVLFDPDRTREVGSFVEGTLRPVLNYDRENRTHLVATVSVFLAAGCNATQAARELYIHPNTMVKRLERVSQLLGEGWQSGPANLQLRLALHLHSLTTTTSRAQ